MTGFYPSGTDPRFRGGSAGTGEFLICKSCGREVFTFEDCPCWETGLDAMDAACDAIEDAAQAAERPRYRHDTTAGLSHEAEVSGLQVSAGLLVTEIAQAIIHAEGDAPAAWCYLREDIIDDIVSVLVQVCNG